MLNHVCLALLACWLAAAQPQPTQDGAIPPKIARFLKLSETSRRGAILQLEHTLRGLRSSSGSAAPRDRRIADVENQLRVLRARARPVVGTLSFPPQVGAVGRLPGLSCHVEQVMPGGQVLVRCEFPVVVTTVEKFQARREKVGQGVRLMLREIAGDTLQEGSDAEMLDVFEVTGKDTYRTTDGRSVEVFVLDRFDLRAVEPYFARFLDENE